MKRNVKGFTILELVVVLAIIGILLGVLVPSVMHYYSQSKLKNQFANAKVVFNASQTVVQKFEFMERSTGTTAFHDGTDKWGVSIYCENGKLAKANDGAPSSLTAERLTAYESFCDQVGTIFTDYQESSWAVYIENYIVRVAVCAARSDDFYVGYYPRPSSEEMKKSDHSMQSLASQASLKTRAGEFWGSDMN